MLCEISPQRYGGGLDGGLPKRRRALMEDILAGSGGLGEVGESKSSGASRTACCLPHTLPSSSSPQFSDASVNLAAF